MVAVAAAGEAVGEVVEEAVDAAGVAVIGTTHTKDQQTAHGVLDLAHIQMKSGMLYRMNRSSAYGICGMHRVTSIKNMVPKLIQANKSITLHQTKLHYPQQHTIIHTLQTLPPLSVDHVVP